MKRIIVPEFPYYAILIVSITMLGFVVAVTRTGLIKHVG